jgi:hypothetical protein
VSIEMAAAAAEVVAYFATTAIAKSSNKKKEAFQQWQKERAFCKKPQTAGSERQTEGSAEMNVAATPDKFEG